jgi:hypothetical protein
MQSRKITDKPVEGEDALPAAYANPVFLSAHSKGVISAFA